MKYTVGVHHEETPANVEIIRDKLTRSLPSIFPVMMDEVRYAMGKYIPTTEDGMAFLLHYCHMF